MSIIHVENLVKEFRRPRRFDGPFGTVRTLFTRRYTTNRAAGMLLFLAAYRFWKFQTRYYESSGH